MRAAQTSAEQRLWGALRGRRLSGYKFARQEPIGPFFADFVCREHALVVEIEGATHSSDEELARDAFREAPRGCKARSAGSRMTKPTKPRGCSWTDPRGLENETLVPEPMPQPRPCSRERRPGRPMTKVSTVGPAACCSSKAPASHPRAVKDPE
ncbi:MAG: endonuclease domain-containing protein [Methylocystis sp.]